MAGLTNRQANGLIVCILLLFIMGGLIGYSLGTKEAQKKDIDWSDFDACIAGCDGMLNLLYNVTYVDAYPYIIDDNSTALEKHGFLQIHDACVQNKCEKFV